MKTSDLFDLPAPADVAAEEAICGAILTDPTVADLAGAIVRPRDFHDQDVGQLYGALLLLHEAHQPIGDIVSLLPALRRLRLPERVTAAGFIAKLLGSGFATNAKFYCHQIRRCAHLRRLLDTAAETMRRVHERDSDPADIAEWITTQIESLEGSQSGDVLPFKNVAMDVLDDMDRPAEQSGGAMTGVPSLDNVLGAMLPGEITVLAARTGVGKTSLAGQIAAHNAARGRGVLYASLEMTASELVARQLCGAAGVSGVRLRTRNLDASDRKKLVEAFNQLGDLPLWLWSPSSTTLSRLRGIARVQHAQHRLRLLVVDYLGLIRPEGRHQARWEAVAEVSCGLKSLAKELSLPVLALAQLNREADRDEPPRLSQLRDSGAVEQDADVVLLLHRPKNNDETSCIIAKNRHGATGQFKLRFDARATRFESSGYQEFTIWNGGPTS